jgi:hypothetical protein
MKTEIVPVQAPGSCRCGPRLAAQTSRRIELREASSPAASLAGVIGGCAHAPLSGGLPPRHPYASPVMESLKELAEGWRGGEASGTRPQGGAAEYRSDRTPTQREQEKLG